MFDPAAAIGDSRLLLQRQGERSPAGAAPGNPQPVLGVGDLPAGPEDVIATLDARGLILSISPNCQRLLGYSRDELIGTYASALLHPDDLRALRRARRAFAEGVTDHLHCVQRMHHKHRGYGLVETTLRSTRPASGQPPAGAVAVARAAAATTQPPARPMVSFAPAAVGTAYARVLDGSGRAVVAAADPVFAQLLGATTTGVLGRALEELTDPEAPKIGRARLLALLDGSSGSYQVERVLAESGLPIELTVSLLPRPEEPLQTAVIHARDLTPQREADRATRESLDALARSNRELEAFASVAAHDLSAPLRVVVGYAEMLARREDRSSPDVADLLDKLASTSRRMQAQVDGLMMLARIESDELPTARHDAGKLVEEALQPLREEIESRRAIVEVGPMPVVVGNATGLVQVLGNLLSNALKYGGRQPVVNVEALRVSGGWQFTVADRGIGLPEGDEEQLFELFHRGAGAGGAAGAGIGLAVCRRIVNRHGGRIWCTRRPQGGAEFHFWVPDQASPVPDHPS